MKYGLFLILSFLFFLGTNKAQTDTSQFFDEDIYEILEDISMDMEDSELSERIEELANEPIDLNSADLKNLLKIPFLTSSDAKYLISERDKRNGFKSKNELFALKNIHPDVVRIIKPFVIVNEYIKHSKVLSETKLKIKSRLISDLQNRRGFKESIFEGNKHKLYNMLKGENDQFRFGIITEKDAGEKSYIDHYAGFIQYNPNGLLKNIILGDYTCEFGQGLAIWSPYSFSKGTSTVVAPVKKSKNIRPFLSSEENNYYRGISAEIDFSQFSISTFLSNKKRDASLTDDNKISNFAMSGYHRTINEKLNSDKIDENFWGLILNYEYENIVHLSLLHFNNSYSHPFLDISNSNPKGEHFSFSSLAYSMYVSKFSIFGEIANNSSSFATINNLSVSISSDLNFLCSIRYYPPKYYNFYANGFSENGNTQNELGYYLGAQLKTKIGEINAYYDIYRFPAPSFGNPFPISGEDILFNCLTKLSRYTDIKLKIKHEIKESFYKGNKNIEDEKKFNVRVDLKYKITDHILGRNRVEFVRFNMFNESETGLLIYQDLNFKVAKEINIASRIIFFETAGYNSRIYEFENDLTGIMTNLPMFGEGIRWYILVNITLLDKLKLSAKYSETYKPNSISLGSGYSEIIGSIDNKISFQLTSTF